MKTQTLHPKILELKARAGAINYRSLSVNEFGKLVTERESALDKRIVKGYLMVWGSMNKYREIPMKGCCAKSIAEMGPDSNSTYKIKFRYNHAQSLALFDVLKEDDFGLYFETKPLDPVPEAERSLIQLRSGTLNNFSPGFNYIWDKTEYDTNQDAIILREIELLEGSVVDIPAEKGTFAYRSAEYMSTLNDEVEDFIDTLPRKHRLEARKLFAEHTSLINAQPLEQRSDKALESDKPVIDYGYLLQNFKL